MVTSLLLRLVTTLALILFSMTSEEKPLLIKGSGNEIFVIQNGTKHSIQSWSDFLALGFKGEDIVTKSDTEVDAYPSGDPIKAPQPPPPLPPVLLCPCRTSSMEPNVNISHSAQSHHRSENSKPKQHTICIIENSQTTELRSKYLHDQLSSNIKYISQIEYETNLGLTSISNTTGDSSKLENEHESEYNSDGAGHEEMCSTVLNLLPHPADEEAVKLRDRRCPGVCMPVPYSEIPMSWLLPPYEENLHRQLTCTLTVAAVLLHAGLYNKYRHKVDETHSVTSCLGIMFRAVARRTLEECREPGYWPSGQGSFAKQPESQSAVHSLHSHSNHHHSYYVNSSKTDNNIPVFESVFPKRSVYGLVIWIGTINKMSMVLAQTEMLRMQGSPVNDSQRIIGWVATEDQYPCRPNAPLCPHSFGYHWQMPSGKMKYLGNTGWGCAQRRPLRAMAHTLLLFDPQFLLVADDDTYVNIRHLAYGSPLSQIILDDMQQYPVVMGQLTGGNKVTKGGFFYGGAGYLMGPSVIERLNSHKLLGPLLYQDSIRNDKHLNHLGFMEEMVSRVKLVDDLACSECMVLDAEPKPNPPHYQGNTASIKIPLVQLCNNLLSEEGTCYHSDHALSRCLVHMVYADVWGSPCWGHTIKGVFAGMCMGTDWCNITAHLTCHRYVPDLNTTDLDPYKAATD